MRVTVFGYLSADLITSGGKVHRDVPGGAALYAALGARRAGATPAIVGAVGEDYPGAWLTAIETLGIHLAAVERRPGATRRARLAYGDGGQRDPGDAQLATWWARTYALAPAAVAADADAIVIAPMPAATASAILERNTAPAVADTSEAFAAAEGPAFLELVPRLSVFAPSREETRRLYPRVPDDEVLKDIAALGVAAVQKRGAEGLAVCHPHMSIVRSVEPPATASVDPTGAGDATVGALAARLAAGDDLLTAARIAAAVGALAVSGVGPSAFGLDLATLPPFPNA